MCVYMLNNNNKKVHLTKINNVKSMDDTGNPKHKIKNNIEYHR